ncbi:MAG: RHS repeat-associated core domain-containing protein, partial [Phycisphaerales bacterium]|nr:RHS repeat-associated core domain-containing protein [Phycisphaerales bacterium]
ASTQTWAVAQRYVYSPYGSLTVLNADFSATPSGTQPISDYLYQGMSLDSITGLYYARNRNYSPSLGVWISQDPAQYINGANTYQMEGSGPIGKLDSSGLDYFFYKVEHVSGFVNYKVFLHHSWWKWPFMSYDELIKEVPLKVHKCPPGLSATQERVMQNLVSGLVDGWNQLLWTEDEIAVEQQAVRALAVTAISAGTGFAGDALLGAIVARAGLGSAGAASASTGLLSNGAVGGELLSTGTAAGTGLSTGIGATVPLSTGLLPVGAAATGGGLAGFLIGGGSSLAGAAGGNYLGGVLTGDTAGPLIGPTDIAGATLDGVAASAADGSGVQAAASGGSIALSLASDFGLTP